MSQDQTTVPVTLSGEGLSKLMAQLAANQPQQTFNPAGFVEQTGARMGELTARYAPLHILGTQLNGQAASSPLPETLQVDNVAITFRTKESGGSFSEPITANIKTVMYAGDISQLITTEMGVIIMTLQRGVTELLDVAKRVDEQYSKAREKWESNNPERVLTPVGETPAQPAPPAQETANEEPAV